MAQITVGHLGRGTYTEEATDIFIQRRVKQRRGESYQKRPLASISGVFLHLEQKMIDAAVVPLMNSIAGIYIETFKGLMRYDFVQRGSLDLPIRLMFGINRLARSDELNEVRSKDTALRECAHYLDKHFSHLRRVGVENTGEAIESISRDGLMHVGAVGSRYGMNMYGLKIIGENIEDDSSNNTTFLMLARKKG